ncbi:PSP1 C-terminal domain-containing protein [Planctomicrobium sp. SH661]|uniref:PSP1 C-terminal domain-containing protein n=1 Tax=Planctomicrobium sp. SH661 TaxID=3448124 RepID=UPI003F5BDEDA
MTATVQASSIYLVRHGVVPEVVRGGWSGETPLPRGSTVVIQTHRGLGLGTVLEALRPSREPSSEDAPPASEVLRLATDEDLQRGSELKRQAKAEFHQWEERIAQWKLDLQLIDLEWTLDGAKVVLYVLNERGPECTKLALQAAAAGLGIIEVQPVSLDGLVTVTGGGGGGCGSCGSH